MGRKSPYIKSADELELSTHEDDKQFKHVQNLCDEVYYGWTYYKLSNENKPGDISMAVITIIHGIFFGITGLLNPGILHKPEIRMQDEEMPVPASFCQICRVKLMKDRSHCTFCNICMDDQIINKMMKRDLQQFKTVAGQKVLNKPYENKFNKKVNYLQRDIDSERLKKWETTQQLSERAPIDFLHSQTQESILNKSNIYGDNEKIFQNDIKYQKKLNQDQNQFYQDYSKKEDIWKPSLKVIGEKYQEKRSIYENNFYMPNKIRVPPKPSQENEYMYQYFNLLPHQRTKNLAGQDIKHKQQVKAVLSDNMDEYHRKYTLPHMRPTTPNGRKYGPPQEHFLTNQTDFINQKKYFLPSFQNISQDQIQNPNDRNRSHFQLG
ncbi:hypothetical protein PPERSA_03245 [Pseudocohnilembus persalinus]|uniref:Uncharacterized protein n=1 Tax=Pseudocohnilembus persalinus TaxID=266149 RepID=A0A0V0QYV5_PSEPJ|nr:hypothetical protein PPERSA_03245 [Pseudocohnilembus persalinus]|eukprot:KRX07412.1 hypothetical protein PPERSA_03245 [Pseudocohnilembus persalinus]